MDSCTFETQFDLAPSRSTSQEAEQQREALQNAHALSEAAAARQQLEAELQIARKRLARLEGDAERWRKEREALLVRLAVSLCSFP